MRPESRFAAAVVTAHRFGGPRVVAAAMGAGAALALLAGWSPLISASLATRCVLAWNPAI